MNLDNAIECFRVLTVFSIIQAAIYAFVFTVLHYFK